MGPQVGKREGLHVNINCMFLHLLVAFKFASKTEFGFRVQICGAGSVSAFFNSSRALAIGSAFFMRCPLLVAMGVH